jgi:hypothetical protein
MKNFDEISIDILIALAIVVVFETFILEYNSDSQNNVDKIIDQTVIKDKNCISKEELKEILKKNASKKIKLSDVFKSALAGAVRGGLTGLLVHGVEGAITGAVVMSVINPFAFFIEYTVD